MMDLSTLLTLHPRPDDRDHATDAGGPVAANVARLVAQHRRAQLRSSADLAMEAGLPTEVVDGIENGSLAAASPVLQHLLGCLDISLRQRRAAQSLLQQAHEYQRTDRIMEAIEPLCAMVDRHPGPGVLMNVAGDVLHLNVRARELMGLLDPACPAHPLNWIRVLLHPAGLMSRSAGFVPAAHSIIRRARRDLQRTAHEGLAALLGEVMAYPGLQPYPGDTPVPERHTFPALTLCIAPDGRSRHYFSTLTRVTSPLVEPLDELMVELLHPVAAPWSVA